MVLAETLILALTISAFVFSVLASAFSAHALIEVKAHRKERFTFIQQHAENQAANEQEFLKQFDGLTREPDPIPSHNVPQSELDRAEALLSALDEELSV